MSHNRFEADDYELFARMAQALSKNLIALIQIVTGVVGRDLRIHTKLLHASGELLESVVDVKRPDEVQQLGSIITYIRRYTITAILGVASEDDDDGNAADGNDRANDRGNGGGQRQPSGPRTFVDAGSAIAELEAVRVMLADAIASRGDEACDQMARASEKLGALADRLRGDA